jgi:hypothetical protein
MDLGGNCQVGCLAFWDRRVCLTALQQNDYGRKPAALNPSNTGERTGSVRKHKGGDWVRKQLGAGFGTWYVPWSKDNKKISDFAAIRTICTLLLFCCVAAWDGLRESAAIRDWCQLRV